MQGIQYDSLMEMCVGFCALFSCHKINADARVRFTFGRLHFFMPGRHGGKEFIKFFVPIRTFVACKGFTVYGEMRQGHKFSADRYLWES